MMTDLLIALFIGLIAGLVDVIPMIIQKIDRTSCISAFLHYVALGIIIPFVQCDCAPWLKGIAISLITAIPIMVLVYPNDKKAIIPMFIFATVLGAGIGVAGAEFIG